MSQLRFDDSAPRPIETTRGFRLDKVNGKVMGVCSGIANYFNIDVTLVRVAFALGTLLGFGSAVLVYLLIGLIADRAATVRPCGPSSPPQAAPPLPPPGVAGPLHEQGWSPLTTPFLCRHPGEGRDP